MKKNWVGMGGAVLLAAGGVFGLAAPANAIPVETAASNCSYHDTCTWGDRYFLTAGNGAALLAFQNCVDNYFNYDYFDTSQSAGNSATSIYNNGATNNVYMFNGTYKGGTQVLTLTPGQSYDQLNAEVPVANDSIESGYFQADLGDVGTSTCA